MTDVPNDDARTRTAAAAERPGALVVADPPPAAGRYALGEEIARGGMGVVYRATDTAFGREVGVKVLAGAAGPGSGAARRFADEARITAQLQHPAVPPVFDLGALPDGRPFLAMKLVKGDTLDRLLRDRPDPAADRGRFVAAFERVCQAVAYAHARNVIHRDLKPSNVMVGAFGEVQVMDRGLAKVLGGDPAGGRDPDATAAGTVVHGGRDSDDDRTQAGSVLGTPAFMAPEQAVGAVGKVDARSDVFGLGAVLSVILTGRPPFAGTSAETTRIQAAQGNLAECFARLDGCGADPDLVALCKRCLARDPADRPADAGAVAAAVAGHLAAAEERARRADLDRVRAYEERKRRRVQRTLAAAAVGLVATAGVAATVVALWRSAERARGTAEVAQGDAETARDAEKTARADAEAARERLAAVEYGRTMQVAYREWLDDNAGATAALLASTRPDFRGWQYRYVHGLCNSHLLTLTARTKELYSASYSPDGSRVVSSGWDRKQPRPEGTVWVCDAETGAELFAAKLPDSGGGEVVFSPDGSRILAAGQGKSVRAWDAKTGPSCTPARLTRTSANE